jgi:alkanesulfonate monooxygenase SsuD/methylene tetrahydromethanopterin reductase-like flavin-dependent oxidoreductase (luciferase family)
MRFGVTLPNLGLADVPSAFVRLAQMAESAGWDGVFVWDTFGGREYDEAYRSNAQLRAPWEPWTLLASVVASTTRVRLGTMVTPVTRRRPWNLADAIATLDQLSGGRVTLSVSLGWVPDAAFQRAGEELSRPIRARRLDEALTVMCAMWAGEPVTFEGEYFSIDRFPGVPTHQRPRVPIWVVGAWPRRASMERALRFDGLIPAVWKDNGGWLQPSPDQLDEIVGDIGPRTPTRDFDVVVEGNTRSDTDVSTVAAYRDAGASWWLEGVWKFLDYGGQALDAMMGRIEAGPPRL